MSVNLILEFRWGGGGVGVADFILNYSQRKKLLAVFIRFLIKHY